MSFMRRATGYLLALLLAFTGQAHAQLALTGAGKALATASGGGGGGTPTFSAGASKAFTYSALSDTTASFSPGGSNRFMAAGLTGREPAAPPPGLGDFKYGGSGGTSLTLLGGSSTQTIGSGSTIVGTYWAVGTPSGATTGYGLLTGSSLGSNMGVVAYENVNQTSPWDSHTYSSSAGVTGTTTVMSVTVSGISSGDVVIARGACTYLDNGGTAFTAVAGTTIRTQAATFDSTTWIGHVWLEKVSAGSSVTLEVNCNQSPSSDFTWAMHGARLLPP
jgi:hypothetical protein